MNRLAKFAIATVALLAGIGLAGIGLASNGLAGNGLGGAESDQCGQLQGDYRFTGTGTLAGQTERLGLEPNIALVLYPESELVYDTRISRYRVVQDEDRYYLELHTPKGTLGRLAMAGDKDFAYCLDGVLTIERQRMTRAGSVYEYSRSRHRLRKDALGGLEIETDITGKYRTRLMTWERPSEHRGVRFARAD
jgi:hypothetical protein